MNPDFAYGLVKPPDWLNLGGDVRVLQQYIRTNTVETASFIFMQADVEAAATVGKFQADVSVGPQPSTTLYHAGGFIYSDRHFIAYHPTDQITIRGGKFMTAYGINTAEHELLIKKNLQFDEGMETYNVEASYLGDNFDAYATIILGRPDAPYLNFEKGFALRSSYLLKQTNKLGVSYYYGSDNTANRHLFGPYAILGLTAKFFILAELDFQYNLPFGSPTTWGFANYLRADYEFIKGVHGYLSQEYSNLDWTQQLNTTQTYGIGAQWFPRPHFEFQGVVQKTKMPTVSTDFFTVAWLLMHYYL